MIARKYFRENIGKHVLLGRHVKDDKPAEEILWFSGVIYDVYEDKKTGINHIYRIRTTDRRHSMNYGFSISYPALYLVPEELFTSKMDGEGLTRHLKASPDFKSKYGTRESHIKMIVKDLMTIIENYQCG